jgi:ubiquitin C-terminal hydrolase
VHGFLCVLTAVVNWFWYFLVFGQETLLLMHLQEHDWKYQLYAVLVHSGWCTTSGHYYCYVQTSPGVWHWMNDSVVCICSLL